VSYSVYRNLVAAKKKLERRLGTSTCSKVDQGPHTWGKPAALLSDPAILIPEFICVHACAHISFTRTVLRCRRPFVVSQPRVTDLRWPLARGVFLPQRVGYIWGNRRFYEEPS